MTSGTDPQLAEIDQRLTEHEIMWLASVRPDGRPHLVAIWFVAVDGSLWFATGATSRKIRNIRDNAQVNISLGTGATPTVGEGVAVLVPRPYPRAVIEAFEERFDWDISSGNDDDVGELALVRVDVDRWRR